VRGAGRRPSEDDGGRNQDDAGHGREGRRHGPPQVGRLSPIEPGRQVLADPGLGFAQLRLGERRQAARRPGGVQVPSQRAPEAVTGVGRAFVGRPVDAVGRPVGHPGQPVIGAGPALHPHLDGLQPDLVVLGPQQAVQVRIGLVRDLLEPGLAGGLVVEFPVDRVPAGPLLAGAGAAVDLPADGPPGEPGGPQLGGLGNQGFELAAHGETSHAECGLNGNGWGSDARPEVKAERRGDATTGRRMGQRASGPNNGMIRPGVVKWKWTYFQYFDARGANDESSACNTVTAVP
jgi:hypothetical protein